MESLLCEVESFSDYISSEKKKKIRNVQCLCYGFPLHVISGKVKNVVSVSGGHNVNLLCSGHKSQLLRTVFCPSTTDVDVASLSSDIVAVPVVSFTANSVLTWYYEIYPNQDKKSCFDTSLQPFMVYVKDFVCRDWNLGIQQIPVTFKPYRSEKTGKCGIQYIARDDVSAVVSSDSQIVQPSKKSVLGLKKDN